MAEPLLYMDTTVFINFGESGALLTLIKFVGNRARIVTEVDTELQRNSSRNDFRFLATLNLLQGWPPIPPVQLSPAQMQTVLDIKRAIARPGDHEHKDLGEIASVIAAQADGLAPVASDDGTAAMLCSTRGMRRLTTRDLTDEMQAAGLIE